MINRMRKNQGNNTFLGRYNMKYFGLTNQESEGPI